MITGTDVAAEAAAAPPAGVQLAGTAGARHVTTAGVPALIDEQTGGLCFQSASLFCLYLHLEHRLALVGRELQQLCMCGSCSASLTCCWVGGAPVAYVLVTDWLFMWAVHNANEMLATLSLTHALLSLLFFC